MEWAPAGVAQMFDVEWLSPAWQPLANAALSLLPIWLFGAVVGWLLPRPKWGAGQFKTSFAINAVLGARRVALLWHLLVIVRELWRHCTHPGTFRGVVRATAKWATGKGWSFQWPASMSTESTEMDADVQEGAEQAAPATASDNWYVSEKDLAFYKYHAEQGGPCEGASEWEVMMNKDIPNFIRYTAWRRTLPCGRTEYKSVTLAPDATAEEVMDMNLDDSTRRQWDGMVIHHEVLEQGDHSQRQQVVRWIRRFPFAFLSDREYTIARRMFTSPTGELYGLTKALAGHPREYADSHVVKMSTFWSMWRSRTVECPWGSGKPACETLLLHHEDFKIPERLARFAVRHGMWGFVRQLGATTPKFVAQRRQRAGPYEADSQAYGAGHAPNPPLARSLASTGSLASLDSGSSGSTSSSGASEAEAERGGSTYVARGRRPVHTLAALALAGGVAILLKGRGSGERKAGHHHSHHSHHHPHTHHRKHRRHEHHQRAAAAMGPISE